ncbi:hypothetical protein GOP47_0015675 [Adiantum capillus-veneris]|uniref:Uncharacterized protein n=1 Tax=Adiantum capillus-veneris TaxID=13818 RepID=A0A9D4UKR9_ADICA|nr:hypothetical protein GOP47_0015675 [Adiantum capillus-veneris]
MLARVGTTNSFIYAGLSRPTISCIQFHLFRLALPVRFTVRVASIARRAPSYFKMGAEDITIHARLTVVPGKPSPAGKVHKLSYLDHMMQKHYLRALYYYNTSSVKDRPILLSLLKETVCKALSVYPLFAGRLQKSEDGLWEVKFNDAGIRIYEATCGLTMQEFFTKCLHSQLESELCRHEINYDHSITPVAVMQLTEFSCGNLAIGLSWLHAIGDAMCGTLFMKAWAETHQAAQILHPPFFHPPSLRPRAKSNPEVRAREYYTSAFFEKEKEVGDATQDYQNVTLTFSHEVVEQLISEVQNGSCKYGPPSPSDVLSALLWVVVRKAQGKAKIDMAKASLCLESRKICLPPLPFGYVGRQRPVVCCEHHQREWGHGGHRGDGLTIAVFDHLFCNDVVFDFGGPVKVSFSVQPLKGEGQVIILPAAEGKSSRNVAVCLPKHVMGKLLKDAQLLRFLPELQENYVSAYNHTGDKIYKV